MKPSEWVAGMTVVPNEKNVVDIKAYVIERQSETNRDSYHTVGGGYLNAAGFRPASYTDLGRTPQEGERAVVLRCESGDEAWLSRLVVFGPEGWRDAKDNDLYTNRPAGLMEVLPFLAPLTQPQKEKPCACPVWPHDGPCKYKMKNGGQEGEGEWGKTDAICEGCGRRFVAPGSMRVCGPCSIPAPAPKSYAALGITSVKEGERWVLLETGETGTWMTHVRSIVYAKHTHGPAPEPVPALPVEIPEHERECELRGFPHHWAQLGVPGFVCTEMQRTGMKLFLGGEVDPCRPCAARIHIWEREQAEAARPVMGDVAAQEEHGQSMWYAGRVQDWCLREAFGAGFGAQRQGRR